MILTIRAEKVDIDAFSKGEGFWRLPRANVGHHPLKGTLVLFPDGGLAVVLENPLPYGGEGVNKAGGSSDRVFFNTHHDLHPWSINR